MCNCVNVQIGTYANQIEVPSPWKRPEPLKQTICLDRCLAQEVQELWSKGIVTTGCCCGHNKVPPFIGVRFEDIPKMKEMGYKVAFNPIRPGDEDSFFPKSINNDIV